MGPVVWTLSDADNLFDGGTQKWTAKAERLTGLCSCLRQSVPSETKRATDPVGGATTVSHHPKTFAKTSKSLTHTTSDDEVEKSGTKLEPYEQSLFFYMLMDRLFHVPIVHYRGSFVSHVESRRQHHSSLLQSQS